MKTTMRVRDPHVGNTRLRARQLAALALLAVLGGCSEPPATSMAQDEGSALVGGDARSEACRAQEQKLDDAVTHAPTDATYDAVLAVTTKDCGRSFHTAGPSHLDAHRLVRIGSMTKT